MIGDLEIQLIEEINNDTLAFLNNQCRVKSMECKCLMCSSEGPEEFETRNTCDICDTVFVPEDENDGHCEDCKIDNLFSTLMDGRE